jgi:hypothetical protein
MRTLAVAFLVAFGGAAFAGLFTSYSAIGKVDDKHYESKISEADILRTPVWDAGADFPPLSARKAQQIAQREFQQLAGKTKHPWAVRETTIIDVGDEHFVYVIQLEQWPPEKACTMCDFMRIIVLMDGTVPKPIITPLRS